MPVAEWLAFASRVFDLGFLLTRILRIKNELRTDLTNMSHSEMVSFRVSSVHTNVVIIFSNSYSFTMLGPSLRAQSGSGWVSMK